MQAIVRHRPSYSNVVFSLRAGEAVVAEAGAMVSMSPEVRASTGFRGGLLSALLMRFFGKESLFVNRFEGGGAAGADVVLAVSTPGDIARVDLSGTSLFLESGALLAAGPGVKVSPRYAGLRHFIAREGLFKVQVSGSGPVFFGGYGSIEEREIDGSIIIDTGHVLAFEPTLRQTLKLSGGIFSSLFGGEGIVSRFEGRGKIWIQTRNLAGLASWANSQFV